VPRSCSISSGFSDAQALFSNGHDNAAQIENEHIPLQRFIDAEMAVVTPFINRIAARKNLLGCPP
jgi:hypothetical protein